MIKSCIDKNLIIEDKLIIEAFINFEKVFGVDFYNKITKEAFETDKNVENIAVEIVKRYSGKIFRDLEDNKYKKFQYDNGRLKFIS